MRDVGSGMRAVGRLVGAKRWMPHTLGHSEAPEEQGQHHSTSILLTRSSSTRSSASVAMIVGGTTSGNAELRPLFTDNSRGAW